MSSEREKSTTRIFFDLVGLPFIVAGEIIKEGLENKRKDLGRELGLLGGDFVRVITTRIWPPGDGSSRISL